MPDASQGERPTLHGPRVKLVPTEPAHHSRLRELHSIPSIRRWWRMPSPSWPNDVDGFPYTIFVGDHIVGFIQWYAEDDPDYRHAGIDVFIDPEEHGNHYGRESIQVLCAHLVDTHRFHRIIIDPEATNEQAIRSYIKVGFRPIGVMRQYSRGEDGVWRNGLLMDLLAPELVRVQ
ncbi:GNAT family N-acetyltransferase [Hoyosella altamirensis]|uniref:Aminoglycoside 6'-N-acetyltransferase n=1 Tax=Hoyosella altamirensis TaxID=616997 RepID=A0A839RTN3_9ACTN|nr:GNAT family protein [Hoyosella altamirensis]MBB3039707.1 aminoglycoside 6'-N-acetyltransferase [Hoyosella altamirensis]